MNKITEMEKELLADMEENPVEYRGINNTFEIDSDLRTINIPVTVKNIGVESDDDVKRLEFTMQKQYGEFDLSQFRIRINYMNANGDKSIYLVEDKKVSGDNITFSWLIGRDVTKYKGQVNFIVCLKLSDEKGKVLKELNTTLCRLDVLEGLEVVPVIDQKTTDLIEQLLKMVETETTGAVQKVTEEGVKQIAEVQKAAQEIIDDREQIQANKKGIETLTQSKAVAIINTAKGDKIAVFDSSDLQIDNLKLFGKSKQNSTPTPDEPISIENIGDDGKVDVFIHGKQLFDASKLSSESGSNAIITNNGDGSFTISGGDSMTGGIASSYDYTTEESRKILKAGPFKLSCEKSRPFFSATIVTSKGSVVVLDNHTKPIGEITQEMIEDEEFHLNYGIYAVKGNSIIPATIKPMLYQDGDGTWESFKPLQNLSIPTPNGLCGLPVESNGNYTDNKEKQWACDEIDLKRGKKISYIKQLTLNGTEEWRLQSINEHGIANFSIPLSGENKPSGKNLLSTHFIKQDTTIAETSEEGILINYGAPMYFRVKQERASTVEGFKSWLSENPVTIVYDLETPIETDLTPEEIADYKQIHTNYPSTVIQNNQGAGMEISYVADTKLYTDNKIKDAVSKQMQNIADLLYLMPEEIQAKMIETDTNNILEEMEVQKHE